jgi:hypothetical protein
MAGFVFLRESYLESADCFHGYFSLLCAFWGAVFLAPFEEIDEQAAKS